MSSFQISEQILAPPSEVFEFLTNLENGKLINTSIRATELLGSDEMEVGGIIRQSKGLSGKEKQIDYRIKGLEIPTRFHIQAEREGIMASYCYDLAPLGNGTEISLSAEINGEGPRRFLAWIIAHIMKRRDNDLLERIEVAIIKLESSSQRSA